MSKWFIASLIAAFLGAESAALAVVQVANQNSKDEIAQIRETLADYIEGSTNGQPNRLEQAFHPDLNLYSVKNDALRIWSGQDYIKDTKEGRPTGETGKILWIDFEHDAAIAKVQISDPRQAAPYIDYFMLLKVKNKWTIIHKMYTKQNELRGDFRNGIEPAKVKVGGQPSPRNVAKETERHIDELFAEYGKGNSPGVALAVLKNGKVLFKKAYGNANVEHQVPIDPATSVFNTGSCSKQLTAFAIHLLAEQTKLSLDDDVRKFIPELHDYGTPIKLHHLVHHTSGLRSDLQLLAMAGWKPGDCIDRDDVLSMIYRQRELNFLPGEEFDYCNAGYDLLAEVVERASGQSFASFCKQNIFEPLEMHNSHFIQDRYDLIPNLVYPYGSNPTAMWRMVENSGYSGSTGFYTTVEDFAKWAANYDRPSVGSQEILSQMDQPGTTNNGDSCDYASGLMVEQYKGLNHIQHGGATSAYRSYLGRFPDQELSIVMLGNASSIDVRAKSLAVADLFLSEHFDSASDIGDRETIDLPTEQLELYTGEYWNGKDRAVTVQVNDGSLNYSISGGPSIQLAAISESEFKMLNVGTDNTVHFFKEGDVFSMQTFTGDRLIEEYEVYEPKQYTPAELAEYAGAYYSPELDAKYVVDVENDSLAVSQLRSETTSLTPALPDVFSNRGWRFTTVRFERNAEGAISGLRVSSMRARNIRFEKLSQDLSMPRLKSLARHLQSLAKSSQLESLAGHFADLKQSGGYYVRESELNEVGYQLLWDEYIDGAIAVFKFVAEQFPLSANAYDSLGEAYAKAGKHRLAIDNYSKSIELNPENTPAKLIVANLRAMQVRSTEPAEIPLARGVDAAMRKCMNDCHLPGAAIVIVKDGKTIFRRGYGLANIANRTPVDPNKTLFRIGSISKALTFLTLTRQIDLGRLQRSEDVSQFINGIQNPLKFNEPVTVEHLLTHTAGFDQIGGPDRQIFDFDSPLEQRKQARQSIADYLANGHLRRVSPAGELFRYDTYGTSLAGVILERLTGKPFNQAMHQETFAPLGMVNSFVEADAEHLDDLAIGYGFIGNQYVAQPYEVFLTTPASSIDATPADMGRLLEAMTGGGVNASGRWLSPEMTRTVLAPQFRIHPEFVGISHGMFEGYSDRGEFTKRVRTLGHGGSMNGFIATMTMVPEHNLGVFLATNRAPESGGGDVQIDLVINAIIGNLPDLPEREPITIPARNPSLDLSEYAGTYYYGIFCHSCTPAEFDSGAWPRRHPRAVIAADGAIMIGDNEFLPRGKDVFVGVQGEQMVCFGRNADGEVTHFVYSTSADTFEKASRQ